MNAYAAQEQQKQRIAGGAGSANGKKGMITGFVKVSDCQTDGYRQNF